MDTTISVYALAFVAVIQAFAILSLKKKVNAHHKTLLGLSKVADITITQVVHVVEQHNKLVDTLAIKFGDKP